MFLGLCMNLFVLMTLPIDWRAHVFEHNSCLIIIPLRPESELICYVDESVGCILLTTANLAISERATFDRADSTQGYPMRRSISGSSPVGTQPLEALIRLVPLFACTAASSNGFRRELRLKKHIC